MKESRETGGGVLEKVGVWATTWGNYSTQKVRAALRPSPFEVSPEGVRALFLLGGLFAGDGSLESGACREFG